MRIHNSDWAAGWLVGWFKRHPILPSEELSNTCKLSLFLEHSIHVPLSDIFTSTSQYFSNQGKLNMLNAFILVFLEIERGR